VRVRKKLAILSENLIQGAGIDDARRVQVAGDGGAGRRRPLACAFGALKADRSPL
jgi:hypothetical protein